MIRDQYLYHNLREYHTFRYKSRSYLLNVEDMKAYRVSDSLYNELSILKEQGFLETTNKKIKISLEELQLTKICAPHNNTEITNPTDKKILPITRISLNVSQICNMKCIYCYGRDGEYGEKGLMNRSTALKAVDFLFKYSDDKSNVSINFFGGEPLLNFPLIKEVVKYSKCLSVKKRKRFISQYQQTVHYFRKT